MYGVKDVSEDVDYLNAIELEEETLRDKFSTMEIALFMVSGELDVGLKDIGIVLLEEATVTDVFISTLEDHLNNFNDIGVALRVSEDGLISFADPIDLLTEMVGVRDKIFAEQLYLFIDNEKTDVSVLVNMCSTIKRLNYVEGS